MKVHFKNKVSKLMEFSQKRFELVEYLKKRGILNKKSVIDAMLNVPRELFLPGDKKKMAYIDSPLTIGYDQTISAPHMNAMMCEYLDLKEGDKLLEIGTGSGYHAALCAHIIAPENSKNPGHVYTIERIKELADFAKRNIQKAGFENKIDVIHSDGTLGYEEESPYDKILVTAASPLPVPEPLKNQLKDGGIMCIPAGSKSFSQELYLYTKEENEFKIKRMCSVRFVPLLGKYAWKE
jgi:protein-L-isoaspartate(D-aspartate) O-methyltransferase